MDDLADDSGPPVEEGAPAWMATFGDMMSLLLTFFVLLLSFATMDIIKFRQMSGSMKNAFGTTQQVDAIFQVTSSSPVSISETPPSSPELQIMPVPQQASAPSRDRRQASEADQSLLRELKSLIAQENLEKLVQVENQPRGVVLRVSGEMLFDAASDQLRPESLFFLDEIVGLARKVPGTINIEGHTDDIPIRSSRFPTNWHLSSARAISTLRYLSEVEGIEPQRLGAVGYADTRPLVPGTSEADRATNRRVEFVFLREPGAAPPEAAAPTPARVIDESGILR